jgi:TatD DNase family protein
VTPELFDTHAHLDDERLRDDVPAVLSRADGAGVAQVIAIATTALSSRACLDLASHYPAVFASAGIHPNHAAEAAPTDWDAVLSLVSCERVVALGETGLDRHWDFTPFATQEDYFARHLALMRATGKPVVIHCREADLDVLRMLREEYDRNGPLYGVMHSFTGDKVLAEQCLAMGLVLSFAGMLTYKSAADLRTVAATVPLDRVMVETDCPYLAPVPKRGQRNEPAFVVHTAQCLADAQGVALEALAIHTTANARRLFGLPG